MINWSSISTSSMQTTVASLAETKLIATNKPYERLMWDVKAKFARSLYIPVILFIIFERNELVDILAMGIKNATAHCVLDGPDKHRLRAFILREVLNIFHQKTTNLNHVHLHSETNACQTHYARIRGFYCSYKVRTDYPLFSSKTFYIYKFFWHY